MKNNGFKEGIKRALQLMMIVIMLLSVSLAISNFFSIRSQCMQSEREGTRVVTDDGVDCQGAENNCS